MVVVIQQERVALCDTATTIVDRSLSTDMTIDRDRFIHATRHLLFRMQNALPRYDKSQSLTNNVDCVILVHPDWQMYVCIYI